MVPITDYARDNSNAHVHVNSGDEEPHRVSVGAYCLVIYQFYI